MNNTKTTKRALLSSIIAMLICVTMLIGTTFAWFTDSVTSSGNIIKSGKLDVEMQWADGTEALDSATWQDASQGAIFNYDLWEPGYTEVRHIKISNVGNLALKYQISIAATGTVSDLADVIDVYYIPGGQQIASRTDLDGLTPIGTLSQVLALSETAKGHLLKDEVDTATIALKMKESAGNDYQGKSIGSEFAIHLVATQYTSEADSFDNQYDKDALYPVVNVSESVTVVDGTAETVINHDPTGTTATIPANTLTTNDEATLVVKKEAENAYQVTYDIAIKVNGSEPTTALTNPVTITLPIGTGLREVVVTHSGNPMTKVDNAVNDQEYSYNSATGVLTIVSASFSEYQINYTTSEDVVIVDRSVDYGYDGEKPTFAGEDTSWYKDDATELVIEDEGDLLAFVHATYAYDTENGCKNFEGKTVKLAVDLNLSAFKRWLPISSRVSQNPFKGTFDGQGHTIYGLTAGSYNGNIDNAFGEGSNSEYNAGYYYTIGLFAEAGDGAVFKNFTIDSFYLGCYTSNGGLVVGTAQGDITFENITVKDSLMIQARQAGGIVGLTKGNVTMRNCQVNNTAVLAISQNSGLFFGYRYRDTKTLTMDNCTTTGCIRVNSIERIGGWVGIVKNIHNNRSTVLTDYAAYATTDTEFLK